MQSCVTLYTIPLWSPRMSTCRQIHIVSLPYSKTRPGLDAHITKRLAILLLLDIVATYAAYWLASLLTDVEGEVFVNNEIYFMLGILALINVAVLGCSTCTTTSGNTPASTKPSRSCWPWCCPQPGGSCVLMDHRRAASHPRVFSSRASCSYSSWAASV